MMRAARKAAVRTCDVPGCAVEVRRGILMCRPHWRATPKPLRDAISSSWEEGRIRDWSANCLAAREFHATAAAEPGRARVTPERAAELQARLLGERNEL